MAARKFKKILIDNIGGITKAAIHRMILKAGFKEASDTSYPEVRGVLKLYLQNVIKDTLVYTEHDKVVRVQVRHVQKALEGLGMDSYTRLCGQRKQGAVGPNSKPRTVKDCVRKAPSRCSADVYYKTSEVGKRHKGDGAEVATTRLQKQITCHHFPKLAFGRLVRELSQVHNFEAQWSAEAIDMIQTSAEAYLLSILQDAVLIAIETKRVRLKDTDIALARRLRHE